MKNSLFIIMILSIGYSERGDLISVDFLSTRNLNNNQTYIDLVNMDLGQQLTKNLPLKLPILFMIRRLLKQELLIK